MSLDSEAGNLDGKGGMLHRDVGRLLPLHSESPWFNMAADEALLSSVDESLHRIDVSEMPPTLRLYQWAQPTLSLGYFQRLADRASHSESETLACVRRSTGGGAIVHDQELTYSLVVPVADRRAGASQQLYQKTHQAVVRALADFGVRATPFRQTGNPYPGGEDPFLCFSRRTDEDLIVSGYKVLGSAQRRGRRAVLQHGSLLVRGSAAAPQLPGLIDLTSRAIDVPQLAAAMEGHLAPELGVSRWNPRPLTADERQLAERRRRDRYENAAWLNRR